MLLQVKQLFVQDVQGPVPVEVWEELQRVQVFAELSKPKLVLQDRQKEEFPEQVKQLFVHEEQGPVPSEV